MDGRNQARSDVLGWWHTVLVVDDDPHTLHALRRLLRQEPYDLLAADRPRLVLDWMGRRDVSLVLADRRMPEMAGDRFLEEVWKRSPTTIGVILTAHPGDDPPVPGGGRRPRCRIDKPWNDERLRLTILRLLLERERVLEEAARPGTGRIST